MPDRTPLVIDLSEVHGQVEVYEGADVIGIGEFDQTGVEPIRADRRADPDRIVVVYDSGFRREVPYTPGPVFEGDEITVKIVLKVQR
jgi:hypothetical protein